VLKGSLPLSFKVSLLLSSFTDIPLSSLESLLFRLKQCDVAPLGTVILCIYYAGTLYSFPIEWISTIQSKELRIFQLGYLKSSTEVLKSLTIREDFSWVVSYKGETINPLHCDLLKNIPSLLNSGIFSSYCTIRSVYICL